MRTGTRCARRAALAAATLILIAAGGARGQDIDYLWTNPAGGSYSTNTNWDLGTPPGIADNAVFDLSGGGYTVDFGLSPTNSQLRVEDDNVVLDLGGNTWQLTRADMIESSVAVGWGIGNSGWLTVTDGTLSCVDARVGTSDAEGALTVQQGGDLSVTAGLTVSNGLVSIADGSVSATDVLIEWDTSMGTGQGARIDLVDAASSLTTGTLSVGGMMGPGVLTVTGAAQAVVTGTCRVGAPSGACDLTVAGAGSQLSVGTGIETGDISSNTLTIAAGGAVSAATADLNGITVTLDGSGSRFEVAGGLTVGGMGTAAVTVSGAASMACGTCTVSGAAMGSLVTVTGPGSTWTVGGLRVAGGSLTISDSGKVVGSLGTGQVQIGGMDTGQVTVTGVGSLWDVGTDLLVASGGLMEGGLRIESGGRVECDSGLVGTFAGAGTATVTGAGATWECSDQLRVGDDGDGRLTVSGVAAVLCDSAAVGAQTGAIGTVTVTGQGAIWTVNGMLAVGESGTGRLDVAGGGRVEANLAMVGRLSGSTGRVTVDGPGSVLDVDAALTVAGLAEGHLSVTGGGQVDCAGATVGLRDTAMGGATVTGAGSRWGVAGDLTVGNGVNMVTVRLTDAGLAEVTGTVRVRTGSTLELSGGTLQAAALLMEGGIVTGTGVISADIRGASIIRAGDSAMPGAGTLTIGRDAAGAVDYAGTTEVSSDRTLELLCADPAALGPINMIHGGVLMARNGIALDPGDDIAGYGVIVGQVTGPAMSIETPAGSLMLGQDLDVGASVATVYSMATADMGPRTTLAGGRLVSATPLRFADNDFLAGSGEVQADVVLDNGIIDATGAMQIGGVAGTGTLSGYGIVVGDVTADNPEVASSPMGQVILSRDLDVAARTAHVYSNSPARLRACLTLGGGTINAPLGLVLDMPPEQGRLEGWGSVNGPFRNEGGQIVATGDLTLGRADEPSGFYSQGGSLRVGSHTVTLLSDGPISFESSRLMLAGGALDVGDGLHLMMDSRLTGFGQILGDLQIDGNVVSIPAGRALDVSGEVRGYGIVLGELNADAFPIVTSPTGDVMSMEHLSVGDRPAAIYSRMPASLDSGVSLAGGTLTAPNGLHFMGSGEHSCISGYGTVAAPVDIGQMPDMPYQVWAHGGVLRLGDETRTDGVKLSGWLRVEPGATLELLDADAAEVGVMNEVRVDLANGVLIARNGVETSTMGGYYGSLQGYGVIVSVGLPDPWEAILPNATLPVGLTAPLDVGAETAWVFSAGQAGLADTTIDGGRIVAPSGIRLADKSTLAGHGTVEGDVELASGAIDAGSGIDITGSLSGYGVVIGQVTAGSLDIANPSGRVETDMDIEVDGETGTVYSNAPAALGGQIRLAGGTLMAPWGLGITAGGSVVGTGTIAAPLLGLAGSVIEAQGGPLAIGEAGTVAGFRTAGLLAVGGQTVKLLSDGCASLGWMTSLNGGTLIAQGGVVVGESETIRGAGTIDAPVAAGLGSLIDATGELVLGDAAAADGFFSDGELAIGAHAVTLLDANQAVLGSLTRIDGGTCNAPNGSLLEFGKNLAGRGTVLGDLLTNGHVAGPQAPDVLEFTGDVWGVGTFDGNILFSGSYSPGLSPAAVGFGGSVGFAPSAGLEVELGGTRAGSEYDQLNVAGSAALDGTLRIALIDGFIPSAGDEFEVLACGSRTGEFAATEGWLLGGQALVSVYDGGGLTLLATYRGDATLDVLVSYLDVGIVATNYNRPGGWRDGDFDGDGLVNYLDVGVLATNYGAGAGGGDVPEPAMLVLLAAASAGLLARRRR